MNEEFKKSIFRYQIFIPIIIIVKYCLCIQIPPIIQNIDITEYFNLVVYMSGLSLYLSFVNVLYMQILYLSAKKKYQEMCSLYLKYGYDFFCNCLLYMFFFINIIYIVSPPLSEDVRNKYIIMDCIFTLDIIMVMLTISQFDNLVKSYNENEDLSNLETNHISIELTGYNSI